MNYSQAEEYLNSFVNYENIPGICYASPDYDLRHVEQLLHRMGDPHLTARTVHIAGTKGKGSVAVMIAEVLKVSGYKTGLYTSPHLHSLRERIRVDGSLISEEEFASLMTELKSCIESINVIAAGQSPEPELRAEAPSKAKSQRRVSEESAKSQQRGDEWQAKQLYRQLTYFEALTVLAFTCFQKRRADFQVLEVGLGGRLDATNVAKPEICIITSISLDHTEILGDSLGKIAYEKAGIIKPGSPVVLSPQSEEVTSIIGDVCHKQGAKLVQVSRDVTWRKIAGDFYHQALVVEGKMGDHRLTIPLLGDYQLENAATAVATLEILASLGFNIAVEDIAQGLAQVEWPGRFHILQHHPMVLVDGAHNLASMKRLVKNIEAYFDYDRIFLVLGISCDKDIPGMVQQLVALSPQVMVTHSSHPRAASPLAIANEFAKYGIKPKIADSLFQALSQALSVAGRKDLICVTGSLFIVAEALDYFPQG